MPSSKSRPALKKRSADSAAVAFERLREAILTGELKEGERVREARLATEWGLGVTPLREAVRRMAEVGYLILEPNHPPTVRKLSAEDIRQIYAMREVLECFALQSEWETIMKLDLTPLRKSVAKVETTSPFRRRLKAQFSLDVELHSLWTSLPKNPWLSSCLNRLLIYRPNFMNLIAAHPKFAEEAFEEHKKILSALESRNLSEALRLLGSHIQKSGTVLATLQRP